MGIAVHPIAALVVAALLTIWLGIFFCLPLPAGPDRAMIGLGCVFLQTPRWICMAVVLGVCVARGAFSWPESRTAQYALVFAVHTVLGAGAICAGLGGLGVTQGIPDWLSRMLALSTIVVPSIQIAFAAWFLIPWFHKGLDARAMRHATNTAFGIFAATVGVFAVAGAASWVLTTSNTKRSRAEYEAEKRARQNAQQEEEERQFRALTAASPLPDWMTFLEYPHSDEHQRSARDAILKRPNLGRELSELIASTDAEVSTKAMYFVGRMSPAPAEVADSVRGVTQRIISIAETIDPASPESRNTLYKKVHGQANAAMAAALSLYRVGMDLRPELRAMAEACGPREQAPPCDIKSGCEWTLQYFDKVQLAN